MVQVSSRGDSASLGEGFKPCQVAQVLPAPTSDATLVFFPPIFLFLFADLLATGSAQNQESALRCAQKCWALRSVRQNKNAKRRLFAPAAHLTTPLYLPLQGVLTELFA